VCPALSAPTWGKRGKTTGESIAIPLLMFVREMVRRTRESGIIATGRGIVLIITMTMVLMIEMVRGLRVPYVIATGGNIVLVITAIMMLVVEMVRWLRVPNVVATGGRTALIVTATMVLVVEMVRRLGVSGVIANSWGKITLVALIIVAFILVNNIMAVMSVLKGRARETSGITASGRERRKTTSQPVAIRLAMVVVKMVRRLWVLSITTASRR